jgi:hypothetical protein
VPARDVVVLVEGASDAAVVELLADGVGPSLEVVAMGGVTNAAHHVRRLASRRPTPAVLGLCDLRERRFLDRLEPALDGVFACDTDLESELIRAVGPAGVLDVLAALGELARFRTFQGQPEWRGRPVDDQLHRFAGTRSGRKATLARALAARLGPDDVPAPLADLLATARRLQRG